METKRSTHRLARIATGLALAFSMALPARADFLIDIFQSTSTLNSWADALAVIDDTPDFRGISNVVDFYDGYQNERGIFAGHSTFPGDVGDNFVMRASATFTLAEAASVTFAIGSDDGSMLSVNGANLITDQSPLHWYELRGAVIDLEAGTHSLELMFFEQFANAEVEFMYSLADVRQQFDPVTGEPTNFGLTWGARNSIRSNFDLVGADTLNPANVGLQLQPVPVPGAVWLFASALAPLIVRRRQMAAA